MTEPIIVCPKCGAEIRLTESLAAPLIAATREQYEQKLSQNEEDIARREQGIREKEKQVAEAKRTLDEKIADQVAAQLKIERARVIAEESKKAKLATAAELDAKVRELAELQEVLKGRDEKGGLSQDEALIRAEKLAHHALERLEIKYQRNDYQQHNSGPSNGFSRVQRATPEVLVPSVSFQD